MSKQVLIIILMLILTQNVLEAKNYSSSSKLKDSFTFGLLTGLATGTAAYLLAPAGKDNKKVNAGLFFAIGITLGGGGSYYYYKQEEKDFLKEMRDQEIEDFFRKPLRDGYPVLKHHGAGK